MLYLNLGQTNPVFLPVKTINGFTQTKEVPSFCVEKGEKKSPKQKHLYTIAPYITSMTTTTIQISKDLLEEIKARKMYDKETYEDIIRDLLEDTMELSDQTLANIKKSEEDIKAGRVHTLKEIEKRLKT